MARLTQEMNRTRSASYRKLTEIMDSDDEPDLDAAKRAIVDIIDASTPFIPAIFDGVVACMITGGDFRLALHRLRSVWRPARWDRAEYSRALVGNASE